MSALKPWREIAVPHDDVHRGTFQEAEFAADITLVHEGRATPEYQDPVLFFQRTFITEGMALLLDSVVQRLAGRGGDPVIQLQTAFGGGKTHTMLAVLHLVGGHADVSAMAGIPAIMDKAGVLTLPKVRVAVLDGIKLSPSQPRRINGHELRTLWGELAWQLGGAQGYARVAESDRDGTSPGKQVLTELLVDCAPCVILVDELVAYIRQFESAALLSGGSYESNLSFVQALTEALKAVPNAVLLASLPESAREAGGVRGEAALSALEHYFGRVQAVWKPVATEEAFEIVRRRLFDEIADRTAADAVCRAFADHYVKHAADFPGETQEARYLDRLRAAYPIHPEVFERLYKDWSTLPSFQRTRGVLRLMAKVIHRLWQDNNQDLLLMPGNLPMYDGKVGSALTVYLAPGWDPVLERDVDGERSEPVLIEQSEPRFGAVQACRRVTRTIFLGSAPSGGDGVARGLETQRVLLGCLQPGQSPHLFADALGRLESRLSHLNKGNDRWWLDVRPNLRREMEERKRRFPESEVTDEIRTALRRVLGKTLFDAEHVFTSGEDIPDDWSLRLVALSPGEIWTRSGPNPARDAAQRLLRMRGEQPRQMQNRLLFLAPDGDQVGRLKDLVRVLLAWRSIEADIQDLRLTLDNQQARQARQAREQASETVSRLAREAYRWLIAPLQLPAKNGGLAELQWEAYALNPAGQSIGREIDRVARENELIISEWAPIHLHRILQQWFWTEGEPAASALETWRKFCQYTYLPRLDNSKVMQATIAAGAVSRDFFGLAYGRTDDGFRGFSLGITTAPLMDELLLIEPGHAAGYELRIRQALELAQAGAENEPASPDADRDNDNAAAAVDAGDRASQSTKARPTRYFGTANLEPVTASLRFATLMSELVEQFSATPGTNVRIRIDIEAEDSRGFSEGTVRAARENARTLGLKTSEFE